MNEDEIDKAATKLTIAYFNNQRDTEYGKDLDDWKTVYGYFHDSIAMKSR